MTELACNFCKSPLSRTFVDLGMAPMVSAYLKQDQLQRMEPFFPLHAYVCESCYLVQLPEAQSPDMIFSDYPYFSSCSPSWLRHARAYVEAMMGRYGFGAQSQVVELASNDGYLLQYFKEKGVPVQGVEPAQNIAKVAQSAGIPTLAKFFGLATANELVEQGKQADLLLGNNVLAHVPDLNDFVGGMKALLKPQGVITMEFPHLLRTMAENQFDQVFHEHFSYLSFLAIEKIFTAHGLRLFDVEELSTHGGSIRIFACHDSDDSKAVSQNVGRMLDAERSAGLDRLETYASFSRQATTIKHELLEFLIQAKRDGKSIAGYGAPGKGCIMLNYCGIRSDFLDYLVDINAEKQGLFMPGVHLPIYHPDRISETKPDYVLILPWNLKDEIMDQMAGIREWGGRFVVPTPELKVYP